MNNMNKKTREGNKTPEGPHSDKAVANSIKLGQVLVRAGRIKAEDLEKALTEQDASKKRIGEILIEKGFIKPEELTHGLNVQSMLTTSGISTGLSFGSVLEGRTTQASQKIKAVPAKAKTPVRSHLAVLYQLPSINLTRDDVRAGYVILQNVTRIAIKSNNKKGCMVVFKGLKWPFKEAHAFGFVHDVHITPEGASIQQPYKKNTHHVELSYRFILSDNAKAGKHPWPLSIALQPL
jgi:hypothetical protein